MDYKNPFKKKFLNFFRLPISRSVNHFHACDRAVSSLSFVTICSMFYFNKRCMFRAAVLRMSVVRWCRDTCSLYMPRSRLFITHKAIVTTLLVNVSLYILGPNVRMMPSLDVYIINYLFTTINNRAVSKEGKFGDLTLTII